MDTVEALARSRRERLRLQDSVDDADDALRYVGAMTAIAPLVRLGELRGPGNRLRHAHEDIDPVVIFDTVTHDLRALRDSALRVLEA